MSMQQRVLSLLLFLLSSETLLAQSTTVTFDNPVPPGSPDSYLNGAYGGIDFGASQWRWSGPYSSDPTRSIYFGTSTAASRSFTFVGGPKVLSNLTVYTTANGTMTVSDGVNPAFTRTVTTGAMIPVATNWSQPASTVTISFTAGWSLGMDDLVYRSAPSTPDGTPPTVTMTSPADGATVSGLVSVSANASDNVGVAGVQFLVDGVANGAEDGAAPYTGSWNSTLTSNGPHSIAARARDTAGNVTTSTAVTVTASNSTPTGGGYALRFYGNGRNDIDRVKIVVDDPSTNAPGTPVDVGATDFTVEFWLRGTRADNRAGAVSCGTNNAWINGNIVVDRDRYDQSRNYGISLGAGRVVFGVGQSGNRTICGTRDVLDGQWHHVSVQRRRSDGWMWLHVDGALEAQADGPNGDVSYPDDGVPLYRCGSGRNQQCTNSDPYIVIGAEKHDAGSRYPSFNGFFDELRISTVLRYGAGNYARPISPFATDASTVGLYHLDEGQGTTAFDSSAAQGGPTNGVLRYGGSPAGPVWTTQSPFTSN